ncbi:hypothetical protein DV453_004564 [Geotrichum candidum]|nr:hypothetical protein DV453_004564 [Geotrichum candidum]
MILTQLPSALLLLLAAGAAPVLAQASSELGCYKDNTGTLASVYLYQSSGYCADNCTNSNYFYISGKSCYCTNKKPSSEASNCNTPCPGFGTVMCGGTNSYTYWQNLLYMGDTSLEETSSSSTSSSQSTLISSLVSSSTKATTSSTSTTSTSDTSTSSSSSSTSSTSTTSSETTTDSSTSDASQTPVVVTISGKETIYVTATQSSSTASMADSSATSGVLDATTQEKSTSKGGISGGAIAGIVIGVIAGLAAVILLLIFMWRRRSPHGSNHDNYTGGTKSPSTFSDPFGVMVEDKASFGLSPPHANNLPNRVNSNNNSGGDNNFMTVDQRLNPVMLGDRRLSEGSIADERDYSRKILRVANPDA